MNNDGFRVAHERWIQDREDTRLENQEDNEDQRARRQHEVNRAVAFLSLGLIIVTVLDSAVRVFVGAEAFRNAYYAVYGGLAFSLAFTFILNYFGLLSAKPVD